MKYKSLSPSAGVCETLVLETFNPPHLHASLFQDARALALNKVRRLLNTLSLSCWDRTGC